MLFSCCWVRPCVRKTERDLQPSRFFFKTYLFCGTHTRSEASGRALPREVVATVVGTGAGVDDLSIYCRVRQVAADSRNAGLDLQLGAIMSRGVVSLLGCAFLLMVPRELTYT